MTLDLGPIKERAERAGAYTIRPTSSHVTDCLLEINRTTETRCDRSIQMPRVDAEFFVAARADIPALVAEVEALRAALGAEREAGDEAINELYVYYLRSSTTRDDEGVAVGARAANAIQKHRARRALDAGGKP